MRNLLEIMSPVCMHACSNTLFTYSINKDFFARPHAYAFRCMGLVVESDWKAALMTAGSVPDRMLYIIAEEIESS